MRFYYFKSLIAQPLLHIIGVFFKIIDSLIVRHGHNPLIFVEDIIRTQLDFEDIGVLAAIANDIHLMSLAQLQFTQTLAKPLCGRVKFDNRNIFIQLNDMSCVIMEQVFGQGNARFALWRDDSVRSYF